MELQFKVASLDEANLLLKALGKLPLEETVGLWSSLRDQIFQQLPQPAAPIAAPARRRHRRTNGVEQLPGENLAVT